MQSADVSATQALLVGAGTVGQAWGEQLGEVFNRPPTVTVDSGTGIGLLFMQDFTINEGTVAAPTNSAQVMNQEVSVNASEQ